jgi:hypothetical protein
MANSKPVKLEVNGTKMLPPLVFPALIVVPSGGIDKAGISIGEAGNTYWRGRLSTVDLLVKVACFVEQQIINLMSKAADLK